MNNQKPKLTIVARAAPHVDNDLKAEVEALTAQVRELASRPPIVYNITQNNTQHFAPPEPPRC